MIDAFNDIEAKPILGQQGIAGFDDLRKVAILEVGTGNRAIKADPESGFWVGGNTWASAPFRVAMDGTVVIGSGYTKINIFKQASIPTSISVGDLWFDTDDANKSYRAASIGADQIVAGEWELVRDTDIPQAILDAAAAQSTADSKVKVFKQTSIPTSISIGDLWVDTDDNNKLYRAAAVGADQIVAGEWEAVDDQRAADALLKSAASQTLTGDFTLNDANVKIDGANKRILINDGTNNRILIGYQSGGF